MAATLKPREAPPGACKRPTWIIGGLSFLCETEADRGAFFPIRQHRRESPGGLRKTLPALPQLCAEAGVFPRPPSPPLPPGPQPDPSIPRPQRRRLVAAQQASKSVCVCACAQRAADPSLTQATSKGSRKQWAQLTPSRQKCSVTARSLGPNCWGFSILPGFPQDTPSPAFEAPQEPAGTGQLGSVARGAELPSSVSPQLAAIGPAPQHCTLGSDLAQEERPCILQKA